MKSIMIRILIMVALLNSSTLLLAQQTGYTDTFDGEMKVSGPPSFSFSQENGVLRIMVDKEASKSWQGVMYEIGSIIDLTTQPLMNLRLKTDAPFVLTAYIMDVAGEYQTRNLKIYPTENWVDYYIDFSNSSGVDVTQINRLIFTPNGNSIDGLIADVYLDELKLGTEAEKLAGIGGIPNQAVFKNATGKVITVLDLMNTDRITATAPTTAVANIAVSEISQGRATITYDCVADFVGTVTLTVQAIGTSGYLNNSIQVTLEIEGNYPPVIDAIPNQEVMVGDTVTIQLTGLTDGNSTIEQPILITAASNNQNALPDSNISIYYISGQTVADLTFVARQAATDIEITVTLDDQDSENNTATSTFTVNAYGQYNYPPTIDYVPNQFTYLSFGQQMLALSGISDGDDGSQNLTFTATSSVEAVIPNANISINYTQGNSTAQLSYVPESTGTTTITLTIEDNGGTGTNNGDARTQIQFDIEVGTLPLTGYTVPMSEFDTTNAEILEAPGDWRIESNGVAQICELGTFHGQDNVIKIDIHDKTCWTGIWFRCPELNLEQHAYLCYDIYFEGGDFASKPGQTHSYYWDADDQRNLPRGHEERKTVPAGEWQTVFMDYRGPGGMENDSGELINVKRIQKVLINYATSFGWPFPIDNGTVYLANIKLGSVVPEDLVPALTPTCTIDPVADQTLFPDAGEQTITLTGISDGHDGSVIPTVTATSNKKSFIPDPTVSEVDASGTATLTYLPGKGTGNAKITVKVSAAGSNDKSVTFQVEVIDSDPAQAAMIEIITDSLYQTMRGFGTFSFDGSQNYIDYYTADLGASAMRVGIIHNQIESVNDNNDPNVLNLDAFDYGAFDFNYYRQLKAAGVETFILTSWSPPAWMKRNMSVGYAYASAPNYEDTDNILEPYYYDEFAESMVAAVKMFKNEAGIDIAALGPQNEPAFTEPYASAVLSPEKFAELTAIIGKRFEAEGLATQLYLPEQVFTQQHYSMSQYIHAVKANPDADRYTDIIATHGYETDGVGEAQPTYDGWSRLWQESQQCQYPKEFWMTETYPTYRDWNSALSLAGAIHGALVYGNVGLWTLWSIEGTLMDKGTPTASFYTSKNYYKYIRPGARRVKALSQHDDILVSSFIDQEEKTLTTVLINKGTTPLTVTLSGDSIPAYYERYTTAEHVNFRYQGQVSATSSIALPARSVTTLVGKTDGPIAAVDDASQPLESFRLYQNYPNPFNPETTIQFRIPTATKVTLKIYNVLGQEVRTLMDKVVASGEHLIRWDGKTNAGETVTSGLYFYQFRTDKYVVVRKCILLR